MSTSSASSPTDWVGERSITELAEMMATGERTAADVTRAYLDRIRTIDPDLKSVVEIEPAAMDMAAQLDDERASSGVRGPLHGIPILVKENIDTVGPMLTTAGSLALIDSFPTRDSTTVSRLRDAGAIVLGKTGMSEWAFFRSSRGTSGWSARNGQVRNPYAFDRSPGGSSSGSGVAASACLAAATIGTETDGSIVSPATYNGVVGLKPTVGLTSRAGVVPISHSQDTVGPLARTVADAAAVLSALAGSDERDPATADADDHRSSDYSSFLDVDGLRGARIGVARAMFGRSLVADVVVERALDLMREAGAILIDDDELDASRALRLAERQILMHEFKVDLADYFAGRSAGSPRTLADVIAFNRGHADELRHFGQDLLEASEAKGPLTSQAYLDARATALHLARDEGLDRTLDGADLDAIVAPTANPATLIDLVNGDHSIAGSSTLAAVAGYPLISVPAGDVAGLPVGISFMGRAWSEPTLIKLASGFEAIRGPRLQPGYVPSLRAGWAGSGQASTVGP